MDDEKSIPEVPAAGVKVLTAGVDPGEKQLHYEVVGWGEGRESWGIEYGILDGDPREAEVWRALDRAVYNRLFTCSDGVKMRVRRLAVDAGYAADFVYAYVKQHPRAIATKGEGGLGKPFIKGAGIITKASRARLQILGVDAGKEEIMARLRVEKPGPGFCHFPSLPSGQPIRGYDEEYFKGLKAEHRVIRHKLGFRTYVWEKLPSQRNEPFDCRILNLAVISMPSSGINLDTMQRDVVTEEQDRRQERPPLFGARKMIMDDPSIAPRIRRWQNYPLDQSGFGSLPPGSGF
jgi:phage terminase large subunit GpA-like protein